MWYSAIAVEEEPRDALQEWRMKLLEVSGRQNKDFILDNKCLEDKEHFNEEKGV